MTQLDFLAVSHAITDAIAVCEAAGHLETAERLRVDGPELLRLAHKKATADRHPTIPLPGDA